MKSSHEQIFKMQWKWKIYLHYNKLNTIKIINKDKYTIESQV